MHTGTPTAGNLVGRQPAVAQFQLIDDRAACLCGCVLCTPRWSGLTPGINYTIRVGCVDDAGNSCTEVRQQGMPELPKSHAR